MIVTPRVAFRDVEHVAAGDQGAIRREGEQSFQISRHDMDRWGDYWRFTTRSARQLFGEVFPASGLTVNSRGNVLTAIGFLHGMATEEMTPEELEHDDPDYELVITVRAEKAEAGT
jgi:hypothetical protein